jgi:hypothetical protein
MGREAEALTVAHRDESRFAASSGLHAFAVGFLASIEGRAHDVVTALQPLETIGARDGERFFYLATAYAKAGYPDKAHAMLTRAIEVGFLCLPAFERDVFLAPLRGTEPWRSLMDRLTPKHQLVVDEFLRAGGRTLLGL